MRTVRLTAAIVGLVLSVAQLGAVDFDPLAATIAVGVLIVSLIVGVLNYSASDPIAGPNSQYLSRLVANDLPETSWETHLLSEAGGWVSDNEAEIARSGDVLLVQRVLLVLGIIETSMADDSSEREPGSETGQRLRKGPAWLSNFLNFGRTRKKSE